MGPDVDEFLKACFISVFLWICLKDGVGGNMRWMNFVFSNFCSNLDLLGFSVLYRM